MLRAPPLRLEDAPSTTVAWDGRAALFGALDVVGFLFGAGAGFFFAAALAALFLMTLGVVRVSGVFRGIAQSIRREKTQ